MLRLLIANDDGINALGLKYLAARLAARCDVTVVAPQNPQSATSHSITLHKPLRCQRVPGYASDIDPQARVSAWYCSGTPSDCISLGLHHYLQEQPPHLVLSGINDGRNVAEDLGYSGTVGAALEAAISGVPSIALSLDLMGNHGYSDAAQLSDLLISLLVYGKAFAWHGEALALLRGREDSAPWAWKLPDSTEGEGDVYPEPGVWAALPDTRTACVNINMPDLPISELSGIRWTRAGSRKYMDVITETFDPRGRAYYWIGGNRRNDEHDEGTDIVALRDSFVSVTPVSYDLSSIDDLPAYSNSFLER